MRKLLVVLSVALLVFAGCQNMDKDNKGAKDNVEKNDGNHVGNEAPNGTNSPNNDMNFNESDRPSNDTQDPYDVAKDASDKIVSDVAEINQAYVITSAGNAYVAVTLDKENNADSSDINDKENNSNDHSDGEEVTEDVKNKVSDIVKEQDPNIDDVFVTTSPDFVDLAGNYVDDMEAGKPISGIFDEIGTMIERLFPQSK